MVFNDGSEYLEHFGTKGQRWGFRRYQNLDGTLTEAGKLRYQKVSESPRLQKRDTKIAKKLLKNEATLQGKIGSAYYDSALQDQKNSNKIFRKNSTKMHDLREYDRKMEKANEFLAKAKVSEIKLNKINEGTYQAGRDFIIQTDWRFPLKFTRSIVY